MRFEIHRASGLLPGLPGVEEVAGDVRYYEQDWGTVSLAPGEQPPGGERVFTIATVRYEIEIADLDALMRLVSKVGNGGIVLLPGSITIYDDYLE